MSHTVFIKQIANDAKRIQQKYDILPSLTIAQACLESRYGQSGLAVKGQNLFGIKGSYQGKFVEMKTKEWSKTQGWYTVTAKFRKYPSWYESLEDHAMLFVNGLSREKTNRYAAILGEADYKRATQAVKDAGYATDPNYPKLLNSIIEKYDLMQYDKLGEKIASHKAAVEAPDIYQVQKPIDGYWTAVNAKSHKKKVTIVKPGTYFIFNASAGMINVTETPGTPGTWINPIDNNSISYMVKPGDNLTTIAKKHNTTVTNLVKINKLQNADLIYPGQQLTVK